MKLSVQCDNAECSRTADLEWDGDGYWNVSSSDIDSGTPATVYFDKSFNLPAGWGADNYLQGKEIFCPEHAYKDNA